MSKLEKNKPNRKILKKEPRSLSPALSVKRVPHANIILMFILERNRTHAGRVSHKKEALRHI